MPPCSWPASPPARRPLVTAGGRVLAVTATGPTVAAARARAYAAAAAHPWPGLYHRTDIAEERGGTRRMSQKKVAVLMGSPSDKDKMAPGRRHAGPLRHRGRRPGHVGPPHARPRSPSSPRPARDNGYAAIICGAGMAAHLAGAVAGHTTLPVIGVPLSGGALNGVDALYATVQMPKGIPVATVAVDGAMNAALLAVQMLAIDDADLAEALAAHRDEMAPPQT